VILIFLCEAFEMKLHAETDNIAIDIVQLQGAYQRQYILPSVTSSAECKMPNELRGVGQPDQGRQYLMSTNNQ
jgi:hypothetical protein